LTGLANPSAEINATVQRMASSTKDGRGFTLALNAIPVNGRIVMREGVDKPTANKKGS
jgi:hypothetical protein